MTEPEQASMMQRPTVSPYATSPVALRVGRGKKRYYVASGLLQNTGWINSASWGEIQLPDVDEHTGHILAHFLCTGTYQTLHDIEVASEEEARVEFKRAFLAFVTANTYELAGLQRLAMQTMKQYGECMTIVDIVGAIDEDFSRLSDSTTDFQGYLTMKAKDTFQKNHDDFYNNGMFDCITSVALIKALAKCVMELYEEKISHILQAERLTYETLTKHEENGARDFSFGQETAAEELAEPDANIPEPVHEVPAIDPLAGLSNLQMKNLERKMKHEATAKAIEDAELAKIDEDAAELKRIEEEEAEAKRLEEEGIERKRLEEEGIERKRLEEEGIERKRLEEEAATEAEKKKQEVSCGGDDVWGAPAVTKKKKKSKKDELVAPPAAPPSKPPVGDWNDWGASAVTKKKKSKKGVAVVIVGEAAIEPEPEWPVKEPPVTSSKKKKLGKKGIVVEEQVAVDLSESPPENVVELESAEQTKSSTKATVGLCPDRAEHLFHGEGWRRCRICQAWLSQVTTEFTRTTFVQDHGYEIVQELGFG